MSALDDRSTILHLHREWWESNKNLDIPRMSRLFPKRDNYLMFNLNGHPYYGIDEKIQLWEHLAKEAFEYELPEIRIIRLSLSENMAWLASEGVFVRLNRSRSSKEELRVRSTEVYQRDDGEGRKIWTMWHFHCSPMPPSDAIRVGFTDTADERATAVEATSTLGASTPKSTNLSTSQTSR